MITRRFPSIGACSQALNPCCKPTSSLSKGVPEAIAVTAMASGTPFDKLDVGLQHGFNAWEHAPMLGNLRVIMNIPALLIVILITYIVYIGIKESKKANNIMVMIKLAVILL